MNPDVGALMHAKATSSRVTPSREDTHHSRGSKDSPLSIFDWALHGPHTCANMDCSAAPNNSSMYTDMFVYICMLS